MTLSADERAKTIGLVPRFDTLWFNCWKRHQKQQNITVLVKAATILLCSSILAPDTILNLLFRYFKLTR